MTKLTKYIKENYNFYILIGLTLAFHYVTSEAFFIGISILSLFYIFLDFIYNKNNLLNKKNIIIIPFIFILIIGMVVGFTNNAYEKHNIIRDIFYHANTLSVIILVLTMFSDNIKKEQVFWSFLIVGSIIGIHIFVKLVSMLLSEQGVTWYNIRYVIFNHGFLINNIASCSFLFIKRKKILTVILSIFNLLLSLLSFSRIGLLLTGLIFLSLILYFLFFEKNKIIPFIIIIFILLLGLIIINTSFFHDFYEKMLDSFNEINFDLNNRNIDELPWRAYEVAIIIEKYNNSNILYKVFGNGFGSYIYSNKHIPVVTYPDGIYTVEYINEIPVFHNGYFGVLFKCGIVGVILYISFLLMLFVYSFKYIKNKKDLFLNIALITYVVLASYVIMGLFYKELWFPLVFLIIFLIKYHIDDRDKLNINEEKENAL